MSGGAVLDPQGRVIGIHGSSETAGVTEIQLGFSLGIPISTFIGLQERFKVKPQLLTTAQPQVSPQQQQEIIQAIAGVIVPSVCEIQGLDFLPGDIELYDEYVVSETLHHQGGIGENLGISCLN